MIETAMKKPGRSLGAGLFLLVACAAPAAAQVGYPPSAAPGAPPRNQVCVRLESQLAGIDRGTVDPARADQIKRYEDQIARQQGDLDRLGQQAHRMGCQGSGFFALFSSQPAQCGQVNNQIQQLRANLDRLMGELQRVQGNSADREGQRRSILIALGQNDCGSQYRQYATAAPGGFFENLFGIRTPSGADSMAPSGTYRTVCVRTCDGYYFPISYATVPSKFAEDERLCQRLCPATEAVLYSHRNPGEDVTHAVSSNGRSYSELPTALSYRKQYNPACSCRAPGQSWQDALRQLDDQTIERGDIVVTEEQSRLLSLPRFDAQGKPIRPDPNAARGAPGARSATAAPKPAAAPANAAPAAAPAPDEPAEEDRSKRKIRPVGPAFLPSR
jgi:TolA-binding protein